MKKDGKEFSVVIDGEHKGTFDTFEDAASTWDRLTYHGPFRPGYIGVQEWQNGYMVRDGYLIHVHTNGSVYVNPRP